MNRSGVAAALALILLPFATGCGDALTDGDWRGLPTFVLRGAIHAVDGPEWGGELAPALVWAPLSGAPDAFAVQPISFASADFAAFEAQVHGAPPAASLEAFPAAGDGASASARVAVALLVVLEDDGQAGPLTGDDLYGAARGVAADHYVLWVDGADRLRDRVGAHVLNPIALRDGYNLAVGLCRPGRPSQLMVVPSERIGVVARSEAPAGACLDVYWGAWRAQ
ncbi:MAG: hypothetical protein CVU56_01085 [Deltaproteobacteria bacterium HGW-Deltaproteobacteria-14]|jgi:hypothetical protein|nr:MAG: hypothetical protein CVU56_01085 [Deltaproteobacteria bacterium HGW-Deltaproteobacteria-14]